MAAPVYNYAEFEYLYSKLASSRDLFAFFLFDDRPSQKAVERFATEQFEWLDTLAKSAKIFFFMFLRQKKEVTLSFDSPPEWTAEVERKTNKPKIQNPSLEVAALFGIKPNQLPGVVLFKYLSQPEYTLAVMSDPERAIVTDKNSERATGKGGASSGIYLPLKSALFESDLSHVEEVFTNLFSLIQECRKQSSNTDELLVNLKESVASLEFKERYRPLLLYLRGQLVSISKIPQSLVTAVGEAFAQEAARRLIPG